MPPANHSGCHDPASGPDSVARLPIAFGGIPWLTDHGFGGRKDLLRGEEVLCDGSEVLEAADHDSAIRETLKSTGAAKESELVPPCLHDHLYRLIRKLDVGRVIF
jgi:hypothetical protein